MIFEYRCKTCNIIFEEIYPIGKAKDNPVCPTCKLNNTVRIIGVPKINYKGGGWSVTEKKHRAILKNKGLNYDEYRHLDPTRQ